MPTINISRKDLSELIGKKMSDEDLKEYLLFAKVEIDAINGDEIKIDIKDTNRPDLWCAEGVAREIKCRIKKYFPSYKIYQSDYIISVENGALRVRPRTYCAVVKNVNITNDIISQLVQLQEKVAMTFGRNRREVAIGIYDADKIKFPIRYTSVKPNSITFAPLGFEKKMTPKEILQNHSKGKEFAILLKGEKEYPIFIDASGQVLSMPPIINSNDVGKVTTKTRNLFIECTGFHDKFLIPALNSVVAALYERHGKIYSVKIKYPDKIVVAPNLAPKSFVIDIDYINKISGLELSKNDITELLKKSGYIPKTGSKKIVVQYPAYRQDIMHQRDVVEDIIISYGYNSVSHVLRNIPTTGYMGKNEKFSGIIADCMSNIGFQEILSYTLTNKKNLFENMNIQDGNCVEIENPISLHWSVFRTWLLPGLMNFLSENMHVEYPQNIFEIGNIIIPDADSETRARDVMKLACTLSGTLACYDEISSRLDVFMNTINVSYKMVATEHNSFIHGRAAEIYAGRECIGIIGEIHPQVLNNWGIEMPVAAFEIDLQKIFGMVSSR